MKDVGILFHANSSHVLLKNLPSFVFIARRTAFGRDQTKHECGQDGGPTLISLTDYTTVTVTEIEACTISRFA